MTDERRDRIATLVNQRGYVTVEELSSILGASQATLRTDLEALNNEGRLIRLRGVAISNRFGAKEDTSAEDHRALLTKDYMVREKRLIAKCCLELLSSRDTIFLDTSNTNFIFAQVLTENPGIPLTVVTNSLDIFHQLQSCAHINTVLSGGDFESSTNSLVGEHTIRFIEGFSANFAFITAWGFDLETGISSYYSRNTAVRRAMGANAAKAAVVCDHTKFTMVGSELLCPWGDVDYLITDQAPPDAYREVLERHAIRLELPRLTV